MHDNLDAKLVTMAIKQAVEQEKEEKGWDWHVYKKTVWVWATGEYRAMEPVTYEADNEGKQAMDEHGNGLYHTDWKAILFDYSSQLIDQPETFVQSYYHDRLAERETIVRGSTTRCGRKSAIFQAQQVSQELDHQQESSQQLQLNALVTAMPLSLLMKKLSFV